MSAIVKRLRTASVTHTANGAGAVSQTLNNVIRPRVSAAMWGAAPGADPAANRDKIRAAILHLVSIGGGELNFDSGEYLLSGNLWWYSNIRLVGTGATVLKVQNGIDSSVIAIPNQSTTPALVNIGAVGITFDGNGSNGPGLSAPSAVILDPVDGAYFERCNFINARGYGASLQYNTDTIPDNERCKNLLFVRCDFGNNGAGLTSGGTKYDGIDVKNCNGLTLLKCRAYGNALDGFDFRGDNIDLIACEAYSNAGTGLEVSANTNGNIQNTTVRVVGGAYYGNVDGIGVANNPAGGSGLTRMTVDGGTAIRGNTDAGVRFFNAINAKTYATFNGAKIFANGGRGVDMPSSCKHVGITDCEIVSNGLSGIYANGTNLDITGGLIADNAGHGYEEGENATRNTISGSLRVSGNTLGQITLNAGSRLTTVTPSVKDYTPNSTSGGDIIASGSTLTLPSGGSFFAISGTDTITAITPSYRGRVVTLFCAGTFQITDSTTLRLVSDFVGTADDTITLCCDGSTWFEVSRANN